MALKISVIIPFYNAADYLYECLESVVKQSYNDLEILLINDGSTDKSHSIAEKYALRDNRIKLINKQNGGQASARNIGLEKTTGDYVSFIDADDSISSDLFQKNMAILEHDKSIDVLQFPIYMNYGKENALLVKKPSQSIHYKESLFNKWIVQNDISWLVCNKLFSRKIFETLRFNEEMVYEDNFIIADILSCSEHLKISDKGIYYYHARPNSTTTSKHTLKKEKDTQKVSFHILEKLIAIPNTTNAKIIILSRIFNVYQSIYNNYKEKVVVDKLFIDELRKSTIIEIAQSNIKLLQKLKLLMLKLIGADTYLKKYK